MFVTSRVNNAKKAWEPCLALILEAIVFFYLYLICIPPIYSRRSFLAIKNPNFFIFVMFVFFFNFVFLIAKGDVGNRVLTKVTTDG